MARKLAWKSKSRVGLGQAPCAPGWSMGLPPGAAANPPLAALHLSFRSAFDCSLDLFLTSVAPYFQLPTSHRGSSSVNFTL